MTPKPTGNKGWDHFNNRDHVEIKGKIEHKCIESVQEKKYWKPLNENMNNQAACYAAILTDI